MKQVHVSLCRFGATREVYYVEYDEFQFDGQDHVVYKQIIEQVTKMLESSPTWHFDSSQDYLSISPVHMMGIGNGISLSETE